MPTGDHWDKLLALKNAFLFAPSAQAAFAILDVGETTFEVESDRLDERVFLVAANRLAELVGAATFRVDIGGNPDFILGFGLDVEDARHRLRRFVSRQVPSIEWFATAHRVTFGPPGLTWGRRSRGRYGVSRQDARLDRTRVWC